jgi:hypothetical protein
MKRREPWDDGRIDPTIRPLVEVFNGAGWPTHHSCSGHREDDRGGSLGGQAVLGFSVRGLGELHRLGVVLETLREALPDLWFGVALSWSAEADVALDLDDPERIPFDLLIQDRAGPRLAAPTPEQLRDLAGAFAVALGRSGPKVTRRGARSRAAPARRRPGRRSPRGGRSRSRPPA